MIRRPGGERRPARCTSSGSPTAPARWAHRGRSRPSTTPCGRPSRTCSAWPTRTPTPRCWCASCASPAGRSGTWGRPRRWPTSSGRTSGRGHHGHGQGPQAGRRGLQIPHERSRPAPRAGAHLGRAAHGRLRQGAGGRPGPALGQEGRAGGHRHRGRRRPGGHARFIAHPEIDPLQANNPEALVRHIRWVSTAVLQAASSPASQVARQPRPGLAPGRLAFGGLDQRGTQFASQVAPFRALRLPGRRCPAPGAGRDGERRGRGRRHGHGLGRRLVSPGRPSLPPRRAPRSPGGRQAPLAGGGDECAGGRPSPAGAPEPGRPALVARHRRGPPLAVARADGHGSARCFPAATGARLAVEIALDAAQTLCASPHSRPDGRPRGRRGGPLPALAERNPGAPPGPPLRRGGAAAPGPRRGTAAQSALEAHPSWPTGPPDHRLARQSYLLYLQLGDGDILDVSPRGPSAAPAGGRAPLRGADHLPLRPPGLADFRIAFRTLSPSSDPALVLLSTDGYANAFREDAGFLRVGTDLLDLVRQEGLGAVAAGSTPGWRRPPSRAAGTTSPSVCSAAWRPARVPSPRLPLPPPAGAGRSEGVVQEVTV